MQRASYGDNARVDAIRQNTRRVHVCVVDELAFADLIRLDGTIPAFTAIQEAGIFARGGMTAATDLGPRPRACKVRNDSRVFNEGKRI